MRHILGIALTILVVVGQLILPAAKLCSVLLQLVSAQPPFSKGSFRDSLSEQKEQISSSWSKVSGT